MDLLYLFLKLARAPRGKMILRFACGIALVCGLPVVGQSPYSQFPSIDNRRLGHPDDDPPFGHEAPMDAKRLRQLNQDRQNQIVSDTARLLQLAREFNQEITGDSPMSDSQMRKIGEIAKLAKSVKERMSFTVGGTPAWKGPPNPRIQQMER